MANIARLGVLLGLDSAQFVKGLEEAGRKLEQFSNAIEKHKGIITTALTTAFSAAIYKTLEYADSISDVAKANDVAIDSVIKLQNALANSGGEAENASKILSSFTNYVDSAANGSLDAQRAFEKAGIGLKDLASLSTRDLLEKTVAGIAAIQDPLTRNAKAMDVFGKAAKGVDFIGLNEELKTTKTLTDQQAEAIEKAGAVYDTLAQHTRDVAKALAIELGPALLATTNYFKDTTNESGLFVKTMRTALEAIVILGANVVFTFKTIGGQIESDFNARIEWFKGNWEKARQMREDFAKKAAEDRKALDEFEQRILNPSSPSATNGATGKPTTAVGRLVKKAKDPEFETAERKRLDALMKLHQDQVDMDQETREVMAKIQDLQIASYETQKKRQDLSIQEMQRNQESFYLTIRGAEMKKEELKREQELMAIRNDYADKLKSIEEDTNLSYDDRLRLKERENELLNKAVELTWERYSIEQNLKSGNFWEGFFKGMREFETTIPTEMEQGKKAFDSVMSSMDRGLRTFVMNGKLSFKAFAQSIISDMFSIFLRAQSMQMFKSLGSLFGPSYVTGGAGASSWVSGSDLPSGLAAGGDINGPRLVGELGPELFIPKSAGTIIPNNQMASAMGGPQITYNGPYIANMQAIDTQSATQFLARNKLSVYAANQSASRSLPTSR